jgi:hypothetical protein
MTRRHGRGATLGAVFGALGALIALAVLPAGAAAKPGFFVVRPEHRADISFPGSHGYKIDVQVSDVKGAPGPSSFVVAKHGAFEANYTSGGGSLGADGALDLQLPGAAHLQLSFYPTTVSHEPVGENCTGKPTIVEHGQFHGTIQLRGRQGFTEAHRSAAPGTIVRGFKQVCDNRHPHVISAIAGQSDATPPDTLLITGSRSKALSTLFTVSTFGVGGKVKPSFDANAITASHGVSFSSSLHLEASPATFNVPDLKTLAEATVAPPAPFTGIAEFTSAAPHQSTFSGDLAVELPGFGRLQLANGTDFAELCKQGRCRGKG